jgi:exodeoxyribonuclease VII small subunit
MSPPMARARKDDDAVEEPSPGIDEILGGLEDVVRDLESGELPLERALQRFEQGVKLARQGSSVLDAVEERVEILLADRDEAVPMNRDEDEQS